jgi:hypothetical protein
MSTDDNIFLAVDKPLGEVAGWLSDLLGLERVEDSDLKDGFYLFRRPARTVEGEIFLLVGPNVYGEADPVPGDRSAIDRYQGVVDVSFAGKRDEELQQREARAVFDDLADRRPDVALILSHNMSLMTAAYLPGAGAHMFPPSTTLDEPDEQTWSPWIVA